MTTTSGWSSRHIVHDLVAVGERGDDLDLGSQPEQELERLAEDVVVLDESDADGASTAHLTPPARASYSAESSRR